MLYARVYKSPPGTVTGELVFDAAKPLEIGGPILVRKPPQTGRRPYPAGFTIEYAVSK
jgi:hypothetical protein